MIKRWRSSSRSTPLVGSVSYRWLLDVIKPPRISRTPHASVHNHLSTFTRSFATCSMLQLPARPSHFLTILSLYYPLFTLKNTFKLPAPAVDCWLDSTAPRGVHGETFRRVNHLIDTVPACPRDYSLYCSQMESRNNQ